MKEQTDAIISRYSADITNALFCQAPFAVLFSTIRQMLVELGKADPGLEFNIINRDGQPLANSYRVDATWQSMGTTDQIETAVTLEGPQGIARQIACSLLVQGFSGITILQSISYPMRAVEEE